ncbi:hypothetical protein H5410_055664 [Solanum commersonii]|uniref:Uncharacterized protein n=1 Tax=Solanum commersonii TaxID=4109 RepID=A0A9J5WIZ3_SOLCO|nr:hypothetical protein H5410_055664 [Solanum commersonii]
MNHWATNEVKTTYGFSVWKTIRRMWNEFSENLSVKVGYRAKSSFWEDHWDLQLIILQKDDKVSHVWTKQGWNLLFRRALNDWEVGRIADLLLVLNSFTGTTIPVKPKLTWKVKLQLRSHVCLVGYKEDLLNTRDNCRSVAVHLYTRSELGVT